MVKSKGDVLFNILVYVIIFTVGLICLIPVLFRHLRLRNAVFRAA